MEAENAVNDNELAYFELDPETRKSMAADIAKQSYDRCIERGWSQEEATLWAKAAEDAFSIPRKVLRRT